MCGGVGDKLVTDAEVARRLGTSREEVGRMMTQGGFPEPLGHDRQPLARVAEGAVLALG